MVALGSAVPTGAAPPPAATSQPESRPQPVLYVTATAHLDTQWLWTIQDTIEQYVPATLRGNFALFEKFPHYVFSFEGAFRYMLAKEYYPEDYARLREYVAQGRWHVCGSSVDAGDVNIPAPESLIRQILYGNGFFEREFGQTSCDIFLPDCFGFGYALPTVAAHCGLKGFSTQKLTWGSAIEIPFDIGVWEGVDGAGVVTALKPGAYDSNIRGDLSTNGEWLTRVEQLGSQSGAYVGYKYFGVGDIGGAPDEESVEWLEKSIAAGGPIRVRSAPADQLYRDLTPEQIARLPRYRGELLMTRHGTGCYSTQAAMKRWNRKNEQLADAAERAAVAADWLGGATYPKDKLRAAWVRFLWHQFHDDLTGTSLPQAYTFSWNDEIIALNQFAAVLSDAAGALSRAMDTRVEGVAVVVFNPLAFEREDVVEATVRFREAAPRTVRVYGPDGQEIPAQVNSVSGQKVNLLFLARVPSVGLAVFDVRSTTEPCTLSTGLSADESGLENGAYRVSVDENGDVSHIYDKMAGRELLAGPARLQLLRDAPRQWSEWEIQYEDLMAEPYGYVGGPARIRVVESGPVRATLEVVRESAGSTFTQRLRLAAGGAGDRLECATRIDWHTPQTLLKAAFPLVVANTTATYDLGCGVIGRPSNTEKKYEVPAQQWADLTAADGSYGVAVLNDCKYGWDRPADNTLRLTLIHSPNTIEKDMGRHELTYAVCGHAGAWYDGRVVERAARLNQPPVTFQTTAHPGTLGKRFSFLKISTPQVVVLALKQAEKTDEVVLRMQEACGLAARNVHVAFAVPIVAAREVNGAEEALEALEVREGRLTLGLRPFQLRTLAVRLAPPPERLDVPRAVSVSLPFDLDGVSADTDRGDGDFDGAGHTFPAELWPAKVVCGDIPFTLGPAEPEKNNALVCRGQILDLPSGEFDHLYVLAAAVEGPAAGTITVGDRPSRLWVHEYTGFVGQSNGLVTEGRPGDANALAPPFIDRDEVAWVGTHRHNASGENEPYVFCYLFKYGLELPPGARTVTLPDQERMRVLAMTVAADPNAETTPSRPLYDELTAVRIEPHGGLFIEPVRVSLTAGGGEAEMVYTLDGSTPGEGSARYAGPFELRGDAVVAARFLRNGVLDDQITRARFTFAEPRTPENPPQVVAGLDYRYYEGTWNKLPDFAALTPTSSGTAEAFDLTPRARDDGFGLVFTGFVRVPRDGVYTFYTSSDDGSKLYIGDAEVVDNDGLHPPREHSGMIALKAGLHGVRVTFFEGGGGEGLEVRYAGPDLNKQDIPPSALFRAPTGR
jgi:alpha-mannosidase